jgi:hypothetical protein
MGPRGFWIALAIVLFYLIARPHIGTVWYVKEDGVEAGPEHAGLVGRIPNVPGVIPPPTRFLDKRSCVSDAEEPFTAQFHSITADYAKAYCASENALLWGW